MFSLQATALLLPGFIRIGSLRLTVYGIFAAAGLIAALWLSQRTAPRVGLTANKLWDAGVFAIIAAFVASRALLIAFDFRAFIKYPLLVLSLPSLTYGGMVLTALLVWLWLRRKHLPLLDVLDAWAPCAALLAAVLAVAHFVEGTDAGMPTTLPWGVVTAGDTVLGRVHPVEIYCATASFALCGWLLRGLAKRRFAGQVISFAMMIGGALAFVLDMLRQPVESNGDAWLDPGQYVALASLAIGLLMYGMLYVPIPPPDRSEVATILEDFVMGRGKGYAHEAVESAKFTDPMLVEVQENVFFGRLTEDERAEMLGYAQRLRENPVEEKSRN